MPSLQIKTEYQPLCHHCQNTYGDSFENEGEALRFIREFPICAQCEADR